MSTQNDPGIPEWKIWCYAAPVVFVVYLVIAGLSLLAGGF